jgi:hypothetical protein
VRIRSILAAGAASLALIGLGAPAGASGARLHACPKLTTSAGKASRIRSEYGCAYTRRKLRALLRHGADRIPDVRRHSGKWGCRLGDVTWTCRKYPRHGAAGKRIRFRLTVEVGSGGDGTPPPVNPLARCVKLWADDIGNRATLGYHFYEQPPKGHGIRRLWVYLLPSQRCAVIGVVPPGDYEYGLDGEVSNPAGGWVLMNTVPELGDPKAVQAQAPANANAALTADYSIVLDKP